MGHYHSFWILATTEHVLEQELKTGLNRKEHAVVMVRKFIEGYWRGPEYAEKIIGRDYLLK